MKKEKIDSQSIGIGIIIGTAIGVLTHNIGLWISLGLALGAAYGYTKNEKGD
jgi:hypothetical protein